jgi:TetR/AcrR family transcriptional regulator
MKQIKTSKKNPVVKPRPGRPTQQQALDARRNILSAACLQFSQLGIKGCNNRLIAEQAGVTSAMIHYYFKKKEALHLAVLEQSFAPLLAGLPTLRSLAEWVQHFHAHISAHPWLPHLMIREVLPTNGQLRPLFLKQFAPQIFGCLKKLTTQELQGSTVRKGLDIDRHLVLLMGMLVYPFMALDVAQALTGRAFDQRMLNGFREDALALFLNGIKATLNK